MPRVMVITDETEMVLMDEEVQTCHLDEEHSAQQLIERLAWALDDADSLAPVEAARQRAKLTA